MLSFAFSMGQEAEKAENIPDWNHPDVTVRNLKLAIRSSTTSTILPAKSPSMPQARSDRSKIRLAAEDEWPVGGGCVGEP